MARSDSSNRVFDRMIVALVVTTSILAVAVLVSVVRTPQGAAAATDQPRRQSSMRH